jgi:resolvase-like protein
VNWIHGEWRTPPGRLLFHMRGAIAEIERDLIRERVIAGVGRARVQAPASRWCLDEPVSPPLCP